MPHLSDVRRSDQSFTEEFIRSKQEEQADAKPPLDDIPSQGDAPRRSSTSPQDTDPAPHDPGVPPPQLSANSAVAPATPAAGSPRNASTSPSIAATRTNEKEAAKGVLDDRDEENESPSRRNRPSEADEAAALALQAIFVAQQSKEGKQRTQSPLQMLTAEVEKEKEHEEEERAAAAAAATAATTDTKVEDGEPLPRPYDVSFDSVAGTRLHRFLFSSIRF